MESAGQACSRKTSAKTNTLSNQWYNQAQPMAGRSEVHKEASQRIKKDPGRGEAIGHLPKPRLIRLAAKRRISDDSMCQPQVPWCVIQLFLRKENGEGTVLHCDVTCSKYHQKNLPSTTSCELYSQGLRNINALMIHDLMNLIRNQSGDP